jgi:hypothetical protein
MNDSNLQKMVLKKYYDLRNEHKVILSQPDFDGKLSQNEIWRISFYLFQKGLIEWIPVEWNSTGIGKITALGIDSIERQTVNQ